MPRNKKFEGDMTQIGNQRKTPFAHIAHNLFENRSNRFERLASINPAKDYLDFLQKFTQIQAETKTHFKAASFNEIVENENNDKATPPINAQKLIEDDVFSKIAGNFFSRLEKNSMPESAKAALTFIQNDKEECKKIAHDLIKREVSSDRLAHSVFVLGALQIAMTLATTHLDVKNLKNQEGNLCPACGGTHSASMVVGWNEAEGARFCSCLYCGTMWNYVRVKCTFCESTGGIEYREIEGGPGSITAECCKKCGCYCKQMNHEKDVHFDVFADDIGSLALDLLLQQDGNYHRGAFNPFMIGL